MSAINLKLKKSDNIQEFIINLRDNTFYIQSAASLSKGLLSTTFTSTKYTRDEI